MEYEQKEHDAVGIFLAGMFAAVALMVFLDFLTHHVHVQIIIH